MEIGSILLILALLVLVALFVTRPIIENNREPSTAQHEQADHLHSTLLAERDQILSALHELDLDHSLGKIPAEDYPGERAALLERGAQILRNLDQFQDGRSAVDSTVYTALAGEVIQENAAQPVIAFDTGAVGANGKLGQTNGTGITQKTPDDDLEVLLANRRRVRQEKSAGFCPSCGHAVQKTDRFCPKCGKMIG